MPLSTNSCTMSACLHPTWDALGRNAAGSASGPVASCPSYPVAQAKLAVIGVHTTCHLTSLIELLMTLEAEAHRSLAASPARQDKTGQEWTHTP
jgi:hypothetical protein